MNQFGSFKVIYSKYYNSASPKFIHPDKFIFIDKGHMIWWLEAIEECYVNT